MPEKDKQEQERNACPVTNDRILQRGSACGLCRACLLGSGGLVEGQDEASVSAIWSMSISLNFGTTNLR